MEGAADAEGMEGSVDEDGEATAGALDLDAGPSPKKSMVGAAGRVGFGGGARIAGVSSNETFALRFCSEGGRRDGRDEPDSTGVSSTPGWSSGGSEDTPYVSDDCAGRLLLNTRPGPDPPPNTRCGCCGCIGFVCFGVGSIPRRDDFPAPSRAFFSAGSSFLSSSSSS